MNKDVKMGSTQPILGEQIDAANDASENSNRQAWDVMVTEGHRLAKPAKDELFANPLQAVDAAGWLDKSLQGRRVLCLAAGGGRQGPLYAAAGADVTVIDISEKMLELDRQVAFERHLKLRTIQASMTDLSVCRDASFDIVIQPVSTCYVPNILPVFFEVARVLRGDGLYISQHKQPTNLQASQTQSAGKYLIDTCYYRDYRPVPPCKTKSAFREPGTIEYLHRWEEIVGGMCRCGFLIEDLIEPYHANAESPPGSTSHRSHFIPPYVRIKARRKSNPSIGKHRLVS